GGFVFASPLGQGWPGALVPGNGRAPIDVVRTGGPWGCAQPLHLTHYDDGRITLSAAAEESQWCKDGPVSGGPSGYVIENKQRFLAAYKNAEEEEQQPLPIVDLQDTAFFTVNNADFTILIVTGSCS